MPLGIFKNTKVFINAPANTATGGPELLHQLCYHLRNDLSVESYMYYTPPHHPSPVHPAYEKYENPFTRTVEDEEKNILIVPEVIPQMTTLNSYSHIRKAIWWLSIDNFFLSKMLSSKRHLLFHRILNKIFQITLKRKIFDLKETAHQKLFSVERTIKSIREDPTVQSVNHHLAQSHYAIDVLKKAIGNKEVLYLSDYLNEEFLKVETDTSQKEDIVTYNPKKGLNFLKKLIKQAKDIRFIPIINMTRDEVIKTLQRAKVYIDFGYHPGKDRIPREAAILKCCVITSRKGSAAFKEDVPIPDEYKFNDEPKNIPKIISKIKECFVKYDEKLPDFNEYIEAIKMEPKKFREDLKKVFVEKSIRKGGINEPQCMLCDSNLRQQVSPYQRCD